MHEVTQMVAYFWFTRWRIINIRKEGEYSGRSSFPGLKKCLKIRHGFSGVIQNQNNSGQGKAGSQNPKPFYLAVVQTIQ
jgi:hypothetical protein